MTFGFGNIPSDVTLNPLSRAVFDVLATSTSFPWAVMLAQANRIGVDPANLNPESLRKLTPYVATAVGRFTSPQTEAKVTSALRGLAESG